MDEDTAAATMEEVDSEDENSDIDFEFDDELKESLDILLSVPLVFEENSSDESDEKTETVEEVGPNKDREKSVERQLEELVVENKDGEDDNANKDTGLENISDNEFDGPESGECDTSDGELPDSPSVVTSSDNHVGDVQGVVNVSINDDSDVELLYMNKGRDHYDVSPEKVSLSKPGRKVVLDNSLVQENVKLKEKKGKDLSKVKVSSKRRDKKEKVKKKNESEISDEDMKRKLKLKKYLTRLNQYKVKCMEYMNQISSKCEIIKKEEKHKIKMETSRIKNLKREEAKFKSTVMKIDKARETSPQISTSSKHDKSFRTSAILDSVKKMSNSNEINRKSKSERKSKNKSKDIQDFQLKYSKYIQYLQSAKAKFREEKLMLDTHKYKSKRKHRKSKSASPEKSKERVYIKRPILSFSDFCKSREIVSPDRNVHKADTEHSLLSNAQQNNVSGDSLTTSPTPNNHINHVDDDKELFITYSDLVEQDKIQESKKLEKEKQANIENIVGKDPELQSISVFTSVLFKGSKDAEGIPFMEDNPPSPKKDTLQPKTSAIFSSNPSGPDEIYDWNDDLSTISQSSFSPSRSPVPKLHNKSILNYLENQKDRSEKNRQVAETITHKKSRSRSKSPRKTKVKSKKKRKHYSSFSLSPSPPPLKVRSPENYIKKISPPAHLKERWNDYPCPHDRKKEYYERSSRSRRRSRSRTRTRVPSHHRSRSSSEERHYRHHRSPSPVMVQISVAENRRRLREEHERALELLRVSNIKPKSTTPLSTTTFSSGSGDNYEAVRDNYDPVVMNEVNVPSSFRTQVLPACRGYPHYTDCLTPPPLQLFPSWPPLYYYHPPHQYY